MQIHAVMRNGLYMDILYFFYQIRTKNKMAGPHSLKLLFISFYEHSFSDLKTVMCVQTDRRIDRDRQSDSQRDG